MTMAVLLYDHRNRPIQESTLRKPVKPRYGRGRTTGWQDITAGTQIDPEWIAATIRALERGDVRAYVRLAERMKERFAPFSGAVGELTNLGGEFRVTPASKGRDDGKIADAVKRRVYSDEFQLYLTDLRDAVPVGWSAGEMQWGVDETGRYVPLTFTKVPPDAIKYADDGCTPQILNTGWEYEPLEWGRFISHESRLRSGLPVNVGMAKSCAYLYMFEVFDWAAWSGYLERYGGPILQGIHRKGADKDEIEALREAMASFTSDGSLLMEDGMDIRVLEHVAASGGAGGAAFEKMLDNVATWVRIAVLGVDLTDTSGGGLGGKLGEVLEKKVQARRRSVAFQESATLRGDLVSPIMAVNFDGGAIRPAPYLHLDIEDAEDMGKLATGLGPLIDRGLQVRVAEVLDRCGFPIPEGMDETLLMFPMSSKAAMENVEDVKVAEAKAAAAHLAELKASERADGYARAILRIVDACEEPELRKRGLVGRIKTVAREFGFDVKMDDAA
jgi:phage gp29-like protein